MNIKRNDYVQPTDVRDWVVEGICQAFLSNSCFHAKEDGWYRNITDNIVRNKGGNEFYGFRDKALSFEEAVKFNGAEMKEAFKVLQDYEYYIFKVYEYGTWEGYICSKKPYRDGGIRVTSFNDFID